MPLIGRQIELDRYPRGEIAPSDFRVVEVPVGAPAEGEVLVRNTWTSVDPGLRLRLRERAPTGYFPAFARRRPLDGIMTVGEVISSRAVGFAEGATVWHAFGWRDYAVVKAGAPALGGLATLARLDTTLAPAKQISRAARWHRPDRVRGAAARGRSAPRRRRLGVGRGRGCG